MKNFALQLRIDGSRDQPPAAAKAWFVPGADAATWVRAALAIGSPPASLRFLPVPRSLRDNAPAGVVIVAREPVAWRAAAAAPVAVACRFFGAKLIVPWDADLDPPVAESEIDRLLGDALYFLHPACGLSAHGEGEVRSLGDLIAPPAEQPADWNHAQPGNAEVPKLTSIALEAPESLDDLIAQGRDDIGTDPVRDLPPHPGEKKKRRPGGRTGKAGGLIGTAGGKIAAGLRKGALKSVQGIARLFPATASHPTWVNALEDWVRRQLASIDLMPEQQKEIERLLHLLETNPDEGLRFAIPFSSGGERGAAPPGSQLSRRDTRFDLGSLRGGQASSPWAIDWGYQQKLRDQYRAAANRELRLGRFRRAAYVFAQLLNDLPAAASALEQGRFFREAALIYRDHLNRPLDAATCFRRAGMIDEAAAMLEGSEKFEMLGDLYRELGRDADAAAAYRREVARLVARLESVPAARLIETKLAAPDEALALLRDRSALRLAPDCVREEFALLDRLARPDAAYARVPEIAAAAGEADAAEAVALFSELSLGYFHPGTRDRARDAARVVAGRFLDGLNPVRRSAVLEALRKAEPHDLLLNRDTRRFAEIQRAPRGGPPVAKVKTGGARRAAPPASTSKLELVGESPLPTSDPPGRWTYALGWSRGVIYFGTSPRGLIARRDEWEGGFVLAHVDRPSGMEVALGANSQGEVWAQTDAGNRLLREFTSRKTAVLSASVGFFAGSLCWSVRLVQGELVLHGDSRDGSVLATHSLSLLPPGMTPERVARDLKPLPMIECGDEVIFAAGNYLGRLYRDQIEWLELPGKAVALAASPAHTKPRVAALFAEGAAVVWTGAEWGSAALVAPHLSAPRAAFLRSGRLAVASRGILHLYHAADGHADLQHEIALPGDAAILGVADEDLRHFQVLTAHARLRFRLASP